VVAQASLVLSGLAATWFTVPNRIVGWIAAFGAGALISAVAFDLVEQGRGLGSAGVSRWTLIGAGIFIGGDYALDWRIGPSGAEGGALGIVLGAAVDGVPELLIFGVSLPTRARISGAFLGAVMISNIPRALAPYAELGAGGVLCMLTNSLVPFAYEKAGDWPGCGR
jgi:ZIP family zinc transporter